MFAPRAPAKSSAAVGSGCRALALGGEAVGLRPGSWRPPVALSPAEQQIVKRIRRARLFVMLRQRRHELFSEDFQAELAEVYTDSAKGQPPVAPA